MFNPNNPETHFWLFDSQAAPGDNYQNLVRYISASRSEGVLSMCEVPEMAVVDMEFIIDADTDISGLVDGMTDAHIISYN